MGVADLCRERSSRIENAHARGAFSKNLRVDGEGETMTDLEYKRELRSLVRAWTRSTKDYGLKIAKLTRKYRAERVQRTETHKPKE